MTIYAYTDNGDSHWLPQDDVTSLGFCMPTGKHYFHAADGVVIGDQPTSIDWAEVTDADEISTMSDNCPMFFGAGEALKTELGL